MTEATEHAYASSSSAQNIKLSTPKKPIVPRLKNQITLKVVLLKRKGNMNIKMIFLFCLPPLLAEAC